MRSVLTIFAILFTTISSFAEVFNIEVIDMEVTSEGTNLVLTGSSDKGPVTILLFEGVNKGYGEYGWVDGYGDVYGQIGKVDVEGAGTWSEEGLVASLTKCSDKNTYNITMKSYSSMDLTLSNMSIVEGEENSGYTYLFMAMGEAPVAGVQFALASATNYIGSFTVADLDLNNSAIVFANGNVVFPAEGTIDIASENKLITLYASFTGSDNKLYTVSMKQSAINTGVENIHNTVSVQKLVKNSQLIIISNGIEYNASGVAL